MQRPTPFVFGHCLWRHLLFLVTVYGDTFRFWSLSVETLFVFGPCLWIVPHSLQKDIRRIFGSRAETFRNHTLLPPRLSTSQTQAAQGFGSCTSLQKTVRTLWHSVPCAWRFVAVLLWSRYQAVFYQLTFVAKLGFEPKNLTISREIQLGGILEAPSFPNTTDPQGTFLPQ